MTTFSMFGLIMAFGSGVFGATIGGMPAFIVTGLAAIAEGVCGLCGAGGFAGTFNLAFQVFAPNVLFIGAAAGAAYGGRTGAYENGSDMAHSPFTAGDPMVLVVGGLFAMMSYLLRLVFMIPSVASVFPTDNVCAAAIPMMIIIRLVFGKSGLTGNRLLRKEAGGRYMPYGKALGQSLVLGAALGCMTGGIAIQLASLGFDVSSLAVTFFGVSAFTLILTTCGFGVPATHHIVLLSCMTAVASMSVCGAAWAMIAAVICGTVSSFLNDVVACTFNSFHDTHIDPPAATILVIAPMIAWIF